MVLACLGLTVIDLVGATTTPGYDFSRDTVSQLMKPGADYSNFLRGGLISYGVLLVPFAIEMNRRFRVVRPWKILFVLGIWAHIVLMIAAAVFQNDSQMSLFGLVTVNDIHDGGTVALFSAAMLTLIVAWLSAERPQWSLHTRYSWISLLVMVAMGSIFMVSAFTDFQGVTERASTAAFMGWISLTALCQCMKKDGSNVRRRMVRLLWETDRESRASRALRGGGKGAVELAGSEGSEAAG